MSDQEFADFEVNMDLTATPAWDGEQAPLVEPGEYTLQIIGFEHKPGQKAAMIAVTFEVQDEGAWKGAKVYNNYSLSDKAIGRLKQLGVAVGAGLGKIIASEYMGAVIQATVYHSEGAARINEAGETLPSKTFANVKNERAVQTTAPATVKAPPVTKGVATTLAPATTKPTTNAAARRA
jgi:hypothetical protein